MVVDVEPQINRIEEHEDEERKQYYCERVVEPF